MTTATLTPQPEFVFHGKTAAQWRERAQSNRDEREASWERSDNDGFLSQWANGQMAQRNEEAARAAELGGRAERIALFDVDGNLVPAKYIETRYGWTWALLDPANPEGRFIGFFNPSSAQSEARQIAANLKKGFREGTVLAPVALNSKTGLLFRTDGGFSADVEVVSIQGL